MLKLDELALFDGLIWLRTGESVARRFSCAQSTVSRNTAKVLELFGLELVRDDFGEWQLLGDLSLLNAERQVHQKALGLVGAVAPGSHLLDRALLLRR